MYNNFSNSDSLYPSRSLCIQVVNAPNSENYDGIARWASLCIGSAYIVTFHLITIQIEIHGIQLLDPGGSSESREISIVKSSDLENFNGIVQRASLRVGRVDYCGTSLIFIHTGLHWIHIDPGGSPWIKIVTSPNLENFDGMIR